MGNNNQEWVVEAIIPARVHCTVKSQTREAAIRKAKTSGDWWYEDDTVFVSDDVVVLSAEPFQVKA